MDVVAGSILRIPLTLRQTVWGGEVGGGVVRVVGVTDRWGGEVGVAGRWGGVVGVAGRWGRGGGGGR